MRPCQCCNVHAPLLVLFITEPRVVFGQLRAWNVHGQMGMPVCSQPGVSVHELVARGPTKHTQCQWLSFELRTLCCLRAQCASMAT